jgi:hypothetical protein
MSEFTSEYYDADYFASQQGKEFRKGDGNKDYWGYRNPDGYWAGAYHIAKAWKDIFNLGKCPTDSGLCKTLDFGAGRGQFICALRQLGVEGWGFDWSGWVVQNRYKECQEGWLIKHDATIQWPYGNNSFDLTIGLDIMEHLYIDHIEYVISEMYRVSKRFIFLQIATIGGDSGTSLYEKGYILRKGDDIPVELQSVAVAGHVTVQSKKFWIGKLTECSKKIGDNWIFRDDLVLEFIRNVPKDVIANWLQNAIIIIERK